MKILTRISCLHTKSIPSSANLFSTTSIARIKLAFDLHKPPDGIKPGKPIIFMHGLFGSKKNNRTMSRIFARDLKRPVYAIDLRNHGDSPHDPKHDYTSMAADMEEFISEHDLEKPTLIGHSMGAKVAMTLALHKPALVANLIPVDNAPIDAALGSKFGEYVQAMKEINRAKVEKQSQAQEIFEKYEDSASIRNFLFGNLTRLQSSDRGMHLSFRIPLDVLSRSLDNMADFPYRDAEKHRYEGPTLFVRGTKSKYVADDVLPAIGSFFPKFELRDIEAGHWLISENPEAFKEAVEEFLIKHEAG